MQNTEKELLSNAPSPNKTDLVVHLELLFLLKENLLVGETTENYVSLMANYLYKRFFFLLPTNPSGLYLSLSSTKRKRLKLAQFSTTKHRLAAMLRVALRNSAYEMRTVFKSTAPRVLHEEQLRTWHESLLYS